MFGTVIITIAINSLFMLALFMWDRNRQKAKEASLLRTENTRLQNELYHIRANERKRREQHAYDRGLYVGRKTDTLYRSMLSKVSKNEQATVMMYGDERGGRDYE